MAEELKKSRTWKSIFDATYQDLDYAKSDSFFGCSARNSHLAISGFQLVSSWQIRKMEMDLCSFGLIPSVEV
jgi:hypothetical protein